MVVVDGSRWVVVVLSIYNSRTATSSSTRSSSTGATRSTVFY